LLPVIDNLELGLQASGAGADDASLREGRFYPHYSGRQPYPVSLSDNILNDLDVGLGDAITWNIQGVPVETYVASIREVNWKAGRQNFNIIFPLGTIENAPTVFAIPIQTDSRIESARLQQSLVETFPNVSLIDLSLVFDSVGEILDRAAFIIQFMAAFTVATGLVVLAGSVLGSRYQRLSESVLLRTLGSSSQFIQGLLMIEFLVLGILGTLAGTLLSLAIAWALVTFAFEIEFSFSVLSTFLTAGIVIVLTLVTGLLTSRGISTHPPLMILRKDG